MASERHLPSTPSEEENAMKALTFLGAGRYQTVTYVWKERSHTTVWKERSHTTSLFPEALAQIFDPKEVIVFVTETAKKNRPSDAEPTYAEMLQQKLGDRVCFEDIPEGRSESELWEIFDRVAGAVGEGERVILDITHAFRSIPMIVFAAATYLRRTKNVTIKHIVYGAYEAREPLRDPPKPEDRAPIFDLTPLLELIDWLSGAEFLLRRSDAVLLAERLEKAHHTAWTQQPEGPSGSLPRHLQTLGRQLRNFSQALHLARPQDIMRYAQSLLRILGEVKDEVRTWAPPFRLILEQIRLEAQKFAHASPDRLDRENLQKQLALIEHFVEKGLWVQATLLAREWVVSWVALQRGDGDWLNANYREEEIEKALGAAEQRPRGQASPVPEWFDELPRSEEIAKLWDWLGDLRNDIAHCGMRSNPASIQSIERRAKEIPQRLRDCLENVPNRTLYGGRVIIDLKSLYGEVAKLDELPDYLERAKELAGEGNEVILTGQAPIWLYLAIAHALHGKARKLLYTSPATGEVLIFDHTPR